MRVLFLGDIYGETGLKTVERYLPKLKEDFPHNLLIVNGENVSDGLGLRQKDYKRLMALGVHGVTLGNHAFSKKDILDYIDEANIVRPLNYPKSTPGKTRLDVNYNGTIVTVIQVMGRIFMHDPLNNPFEGLDALLASIDSDHVIVDVHAETTSEKLALGHYLDGRVDAIIGTHTHVATNDAMTLPKGSLYITDVGMCGAKYGILGADKDLVLQKFTTGMPIRLKPDLSKSQQLNGVLLDLEKKTITPVQYSD